jgi:hypothetical protein
VWFVRLTLEYEHFAFWIQSVRDRTMGQNHHIPPHKGRSGVDQTKIKYKTADACLYTVVLAAEQVGTSFPFFLSSKIFFREPIDPAFQGGIFVRHINTIGNVVTIRSCCGDTANAAAGRLVWHWLGWHDPGRLRL